MARQGFMRQESMRQATSFPWPAHLLALLLYLLVSLLATWPLALHFSTHVTGDGIDDPALAWNLWWVNFTLVERLQPDIFHSGWMFHPIDINLGFYTLTPLNGLLSIPLQSAATVTIANNLLLLSSLILGGYGAFLLCRAVWPRQLRANAGWLGWAICWLAGAFYAFAGAKLFYASLGQFNIASSQWIPFCALYLWRTLHSSTRQSTWRNGFLAGLFLVFQAWAELTYASFLLLLFLLAYLYFTVLWLVASPRQVMRWWQSTLGMVAAALVFALGIAPFLAAMLPDMRVEGDFFASGGGFADVFSADLMGYLVPTQLHPWVGAWVAQLPFANDKAQHIYLGYTLLFLLVVGIIAGLRHHRERATAFFWLVALLFFWLLTLGPYLRWSGADLPIPGPFSLVSQLPFFSGNRYPSRYSVMLLLCAAVLAARGLLWLLNQQALRHHHARAFATVALVAALFSVEHVSTPLPLNDFRIPPIYQRLAAEVGDFAVLELPTGWRNGARVLGKSDTLIMMQQWYQSSHAKRRLGGNTSRNPAYKFQYFSETPLIGDLIALMISDRGHLSPSVIAEYPAMVERVRRNAPLLFDLLGIHFVTLHVEKAPPLLQQFVEDALPVTLIEEWQGPDWTGAPSTIRLYRVEAAPQPAEYTIDLATQDAQMFLAEGWSPLGVEGVGRYATRDKVELLLPPLPNGATLTLEFAQPTSVSYAYAGLQLGQQSGTLHTLELPGQNSGEPAARLTLRFDDAPTPIAQLVPHDSPIGSTGVSLEAGVAILAQSAGEEVGNFAHLWINGVNYASSERGYNLVALTTTGEVLASATFDTMLPGESTRMAEWLNQWQEGTVVAGAVADAASTEDSAVWDTNVLGALQRFGVAGDLRGKLRWSHAFVGVAGAPPASALEDIEALRPAAVWLGVPLPSTTGYGPLLSVTIQRH
jgi:hypothetical protein